MNTSRMDGDLTVRMGGGAMFDRIARRYDRMNTVLSFGLHHLWRGRLIRAMALTSGDEGLDVACGTADVAIAAAQAHPEVQVTGLDPSEGMLGVGAEKVATAKLTQRVALTVGDAQCLPFTDDRFAATAISFGIRNVPDRALGLREMARVTRPGGRVCVLELGVPRSGLLAPLARLHVRFVVPLLGRLFAGKDEYRYLQESVEGFPTPEEFAALMARNGLRDVTVQPQSFGAAHLYVGIVDELDQGAT
jgi:demethylmenaquinone methyltransferase / 2-methoxy-6-polyprenyl-1,4-benzoquinol methylase